MSFLAFFHSASAHVEEKIYCFRVSLSVYIGLVRASLEEKWPFLSRHRITGVLLALSIICFIQFLIGIIFLLKSGGKLFFLIGNWIVSLNPVSSIRSFL
ncbi:MAG: hypothetical protein V1776_05235 [Candidatus Diapherotrites archaeon]